MRKFWSRTAVPSLRSELGQQILLYHGNLGLRLKLNSYWIFSDITHTLCPGQPKGFLQMHEEDIDIIDPLVGLSPRLLSIYAYATLETLEQQPLQKSVLLRALTQITQRIPHIEDLSTQENEILKGCADAYLEGAYIYVLCRRQRSVDPLLVSLFYALLIPSDCLLPIHRSSITEIDFDNFWTLRSCLCPVIFFGPCGLYCRPSYFVLRAMMRKRDILCERE